MDLVAASAFCAWRKIPACANIWVSRDEQVARLHKIGVDAEKASVQTRADMELRHIELRELMRADNPDHDAIMQKLDEVNALQGKMEKQRVETMLSARGVLTPEQQKKIKTFMENRGAGGGPERGRMMERRGGMGRPPGHPGGAPGGSTPNRQNHRLSENLASQCRWWSGAPFHRRLPIVVTVVVKLSGGLPSRCLVREVRRLIV